MRKVLPLTVLLAVPASVWAQESVDMTGDILEVYADDFANHRAERFYVLHDQTSGGLYRMRFRDGEQREFHTGDRVRVRGRKQNHEVVLAANDATVQAVEVAPTSGVGVAGEQKTIVIAINFQNANLECSQSQIRGYVFDGTQSVNGMYQETSFGNLWFTGNVVGPYTINYNSSNACDYSAWATAADVAATAAGVTLSQYNRKVYVFSKVNGCGWAGLGTVGGNPSRAWIATCDLADVYAHELGHNLGMQHASTDANNDDVADCEYCDNSDIMGYGGVGLRTLNAAHKEQMGWESASKIQNVSGNGVFNVAPLEYSSLDTPYVQTLKILKPGTTEFYYFSYRRKVGYDVNMPTSYADRTSVHHYQGSSAKTFLVGTLPDSGSFTDASGLTVRQLSHNNDFVTLDVSYGCAPAAPSVTATPADQSAAAGTTVSYTINVVNADSSSCGNSTFQLSPAVPSGWSSTLQPTSMTLAPGQTGSAQLTLTSPGNVASGTYTGAVSVTDNFNLTHNATANVTYSIGGAPPADLTPPTAPGNLVATSRRRRVALSWTRSTDNVAVAFYVVKRDGTVIGQTTGATFTDRGVIRGVTYSYVVTAIDAAGNESASSNVASILAAGRQH